MEGDARDRYLVAAHAMQSGIAMKMNYEPSETTPKHLRVGVNSALVEHSALAKLLIEKGVISDQEYIEGLAEAMEAEAQRYEEWARERLGGNVSFA